MRSLLGWREYHIVYTYRYTTFTQMFDMKYSQMHRMETSVCDLPLDDHLPSAICHLA